MQLAVQSIAEVVVAPKPQVVAGAGPQIRSIMGSGWTATSSTGDLVKIGDVGLPTEIMLHRESLDGVAPEVTVVFEAQEAVPRCRSVEFHMIDGGREVRPQDLRSLDLPGLLEQLFAQHSVRITDLGAGRFQIGLPITADEIVSARRAVRGARKGRTPRRITEGLLRQVAETYLNPPANTGSREAVQAKFGVSTRMAFEYIARCRAHEPALIPPSESSPEPKGARDGKRQKKA